jgi:hypothetical protein
MYLLIFSYLYTSPQSEGTSNQYLVKVVFQCSDAHSDGDPSVGDRNSGVVQLE